MEPVLGGEGKAVVAENDFAVGVAGDGDGVDDGEDGPGFEDEGVNLGVRKAERGIQSAEPGGFGADGVVEAEEGLMVAPGGGLGGNGAGPGGAGFMIYDFGFTI